MDTETKQNQNPTDTSASSANRTGNENGKGRHATQSGAGTDCAGASCAGISAPDMMSLLEQAPIPTGMCSWLSCLRKSGMTLSYSMEKRHIPDMDLPRREPASLACGCTDSKNGNRSNGSDSVGEKKTVGASDTMHCAGSCSVRYFDLAVGAMLVLTVCTLLKGCMCLKRKMF